MHLELKNEDVHFRYWTPSQRRELDRINDLVSGGHTSIKESLLMLRVLSLQVLRGIDHKVELICGPISTGGTNVLQENIAIFQEMIVYHTRVLDYPVFSQIPFEVVLRKVNIDYRSWWNSLSPRRQKIVPRYCFPIMEVFYKGIFDSGKFSRFNFIPDWEGSQGTNWEMDYVLASYEYQHHEVMLRKIPRTILNQIKTKLGIRVPDSETILILDNPSAEFVHAA